MTETDALILLNAVKGLGNAGIRKLIQRFGSAINVLNAPEQELLENPVVPNNVIRNILDFSRDKFLDSEYNLMRKHQVQVVTCQDPEYPALLREIPDAPIVLYVKGKLQELQSLSIGLVGSRKASLYGLTTSEKLARQFAEYGLTVVSGLARGIDSAAHKGALRGGGTTVAVLGCGLSHVYPLENRDLLEEIVHAGAVVSEFPMGMRPLPHNFPRRNRIVSGLSRAVIVVEAALRSGALITADYALEQGRDVYAVPGKIDQRCSQGVNQLIRQGAQLITSVDDVLEDMAPQLRESQLESSRKEVSRISKCCAPEKDEIKPKSQRNKTICLSEDERRVYEYIHDRPVHIDDLTSNLESNVPVMSILLKLELKQLVKQLPGKLFVR